MVNRLFHFLKQYLGFTQKESRGFLLVVPALFLLFLIPSIINWVYQAKSKQEYEQYLEQASFYFSEMDKEDSGTARQPTTISITNLNSPHDGAQDSAKRKGQNLKQTNTPELNKVPFHEADAVLLQMVSGMGPVLSGRVEEFRAKLGGFYKKEQILEVYGIDAALGEKIYEAFPFDSISTKKIKINEVDLKTLASHPYVAYGEAKVILAFRKQHGAYADKEDLLQIKIFNREWVDRLAPYLDF